MHRRWEGSRNRRCALLATALATAGFAQMAQGITASWVSAASGTWSNAPNWSTNPTVPNGNTFDAIIDATGASYIPTLNSNITVNSFTLNSASATFTQTSNTFTVPGAINLQAGTYLFNNGTIASATINASGGQWFSARCTPASSAGSRSTRQSRWTRTTLSCSTVSRLAMSRCR